MLDQAVHLRHAGACGDQYQRTIGQLSQVSIAKRHLEPRHTVALQLCNQCHRTVFAGQHVQLKFASAMGGRCQGEGRLVARFALDHQVLPGMVTRRFARRRPQAHPPDVATDLNALTQLTGQCPYWQLA
ncbi:hypothetical protein D3C79_960220 [compost metagenome]